MATVTMDKVNKVYENGFHAVKDMDMAVADGEFMVLVGPSGCGKTTTLRMVAGLEDITSGTLRIGGKAVNDETPKERDIAMVFQNYALYPHMTVAENLAFGLKLRRLGRAEIAPSLISSSPATIRSAVVLPQPDGPTKTMNSPSPIASSSESTARVPSE